MARADPLAHPVALRRRVRGWSQQELAQRAGLPRSSLSAIETRDLIPSVKAALALARALECSVEELFGQETQPVSTVTPAWAWPPRGKPVRFWEAEVDGRRWLYPVEALSLNPWPHDGVWRPGADPPGRPEIAKQTLLLACCDPAAGLWAAEYARTTGFRLLVFPRGGVAALELLKRRVVHVAGLHRATDRAPHLNAETVRTMLGPGFRLVRAALWVEGLALPPEDRPRSANELLRRRCRWALREPGSAARECLEEWIGHRRLPGRVVDGHGAVAEAVRAGWAQAGVCVQLAAVEAGLNFLPLRREILDLCFPESLARDPRVLALLRLLRSRRHRGLVSELPGYDAGQTGELLVA